MSQTNIWWIRRDIRLNDNQTLHAALEDAEYLVPLFIIEPELNFPIKYVHIVKSCHDTWPQIH